MNREKMEKIWDILILTGESWGTIRDLPEEEFNFLHEKAHEAKLRAIEEARRNKY